ncbi:hypothetical protein NZK35_05600 [Stieleria sp. ICT_E10.1]|uniref:hypothetical protein n=1 Tax=Stieleria sedimenti TaxID=2976331 RepID=UPI0021805AE1|nr:hypothetical protein [Stieleria sedimenti]MCS7466148.1 hypothetical protein [Stieleria sedimenti]
MNRQTNTLADIYEQQVLDNLARFVVNQGSTPMFAVPSGGGTTINHSNTANGGLLWNPTRLATASAGINGTRTLAENWTLRPINETRRLALMKCVYQYTIGCVPTNTTESRWADFATFYDKKNIEEILPQRFFQVCDSKPKASDCCVKYAEYCGKYVVVSESQFECLSRLTLAILEIATLSDDAFAARFPSDPTVDVTESFIASYDGKLVLVKGTRTISADKYDDLLEKKTFDLQSALGNFFSDQKDAEMTKSIGSAIEGLIEEGVKPSSIKTLPRSVPQRSGSSQTDRGSSIESLLQMNQVIQPGSF